MTRARVALVVVAVAAACVSEKLTGPTGPAAPDGRIPGPQLAPGDNFGTFVLPGPPNNNVPTPTQNTGIVLPPTVPVRVTVTGQLRFDVNPGFEPCARNPPVTLPGANPVGPAGFDQGNRPYAVVMGLGDATNPPSSAFAIRPLSSASPTTTAFVQGPGVIWAGRPVIIPNACEGPGTGFQTAYFVSGSQTIVAEELSPAVLVPDKTTINVGELVTFHLEIPWTTNFFVTGSWSWVPDPPGSSNTRFITGCGSGATTCTMEVHERGHAQLDGIVAEGAIFMTAVSPNIEVRTDQPNLVLTVSPADLHPRIRQLTVNGILQAERQPGEGDVTVTITRGGDPEEGVDVTVRAEFLPGTGGHAHIAAPLRFETAPTVTQGPESGQPVVGYFRRDGKRTMVQAATDASGRVEADIVAGYLGGDVNVIAEATVGGQALAETTLVRVRVPSLTDLENQITSVYWIGGTTPHPQGENWHVVPGVVNGLQDIATSLQTTVAGATVFLQYNDASLPNGGSFSEAPNPLDDPFRSHEAHAVGLDIDIAFCYARQQGNDDQVHRVRGPNCVEGGGPPQPQLRVRQRELDAAADDNNGVNRVHNGTHYHIRFRN